MLVRAVTLDVKASGSTAFTNLPRDKKSAAATSTNAQQPKKAQSITLCAFSEN
jgi:hypothetical protein